MHDINDIKVKKYIDRNRPRLEIRDELDIGYTYDGRSIELYERRPIWNDKSKYHDLSFAKFTYVKSAKMWKFFWMRGSGNWEAYSPMPSSPYLDELLDCVEKDELYCFKG